MTINVLSKVSRDNNKVVLFRVGTFCRQRRATGIFTHVKPKSQTEQLHATVMKNGHVCLGPDKHYYSVPYRFIGKKIKLLYSNSSVEAFYHYERIAVHKRIKSPYTYTTDKDHMPTTHQFVTEWTPDKFLGLAASIH